MGNNSSSPDIPAPPPSAFPSIPIPSEDTTGWVCYAIHLLQPKTTYLLDCWDTGLLPLRGGSCGTFTLEAEDAESHFTLFTTLKIPLFSWDPQRGTFDRVTFQDNPEDHSTFVIFTRGGTSIQKRPLPIPAFPADFYLTGDRDFQVNGNGANLQVVGDGAVEVHGSLAQLEQDDGLAKITVLEGVKGRIYQKKRGSIVIRGGVVGYIVQEGNGSIEVEGDVRGEIEQTGNGTIHVKGRLIGKIVNRRGFGQITIDKE